MIFRVVDNGLLKEEKMWDLLMIDVRFWKAFSVFYGNGTKLAQHLFLDQQQCFDNENEGIEISLTLLDKITEESDATYPILGKNTTRQDAKEI